jgi:hypothetical protein
MSIHKQPKRNCPSCGTEVNGNVDFCFECGTDLTPAALKKAIDEAEGSDKHIDIERFKSLRPILLLFGLLSIGISIVLLTFGIQGIRDGYVLTGVIYLAIMVVLLSQFYFLKMIVDFLFELYEKKVDKHPKD